MDKITFTVKEAAEIIGISPSKMYQLVRENQVPHISLGKRTVIPKQGFFTWVNQAATGGI
ncbi:MAG: helix-turn-helix domain-containing protein [Candidatus Fimivivens sp.]|jgi:excisionase family DNA binding protein|nr:Helix-turn-helix domain [Oscillospiraceae bacterium]MEA5134999.1 helix-turn-helix domain-containing protein [Candidatus Fimivivens sp.]